MRKPPQQHQQQQKHLEPQKAKTATPTNILIVCHNIFDPVHDQTNRTITVRTGFGLRSFACTFVYLFVFVKLLNKINSNNNHKQRIKN